MKGDANLQGPLGPDGRFRKPWTPRLGPGRQMPVRREKEETPEEAYERVRKDVERQLQESRDDARRKVEIEIYGHALSDSEREGMDRAYAEEVQRRLAELDCQKAEWLEELERLEEESSRASRKRAEAQDREMMKDHRRRIRENRWLAGAGPYPKDEEE